MLDNPRAARERVHRPQAVADEVVGVKSVDTMELVKLVVVVRLTRNTPIKMRKSQLQRNQRARVLVTCMSMASGHRDACLTLMLGHPTLLTMRTHCHPNVRPLVMRVRNTHPILMPTSLLPTCMVSPIIHWICP